MICRRCLFSLRKPSQVRTFTTSPFLSKPIATPAAASQPVFSQPITLKPRPTDLPVSIAPAGTPLKGLNYTKGRDDPVALDESEYPAWLWTCLEAKKGSEESGEGNEGDEFCTFPISTPHETSSRYLLYPVSSHPTLKDEMGNFSE
jgi:large subunit ribosomal protein L54